MPAGKKLRKKKAAKEPPTPSVMEEDTAAAGSTEAPPKSKRKRRTSENASVAKDAAEDCAAPPSKKNKKDLVNERKTKLLEDSRADAKEDFEGEREETLASLPVAYKQMFGKIGFTKYGKKKLLIPVLILSPYDVPGGEDSVRDQWLAMFKRVRTVKSMFCFLRA